MDDVHARLAASRAEVGVEKRLGSFVANFRARDSEQSRCFVDGDQIVIFIKNGDSRIDGARCLRAYFHALAVFDEALRVALWHAVHAHAIVLQHAPQRRFGRVGEERLERVEQSL